MNKVFTAKFLQHLNKKKADNQEKGFTLIELLVVVIIIGVLAAVALPNLLSQVGKARESEAKTTVGSVNRAQQAYHFERQTFAPTATNIETAGNPLGIVVDPEYYSYSITANGGTDAHVLTTAPNGVNDGVRNYGGKVVYNTGSYVTAVCQTDSVNGTATIAANANLLNADETDNCGANNTELN